MSDVLLLNDNMVFGTFGTSRYMGPYVLASQLERQGIETRVIDYFTRHPDFFNYLESFLSSETRILGIATTFFFHSKIFFKSIAMRV